MGFFGIAADMLKRIGRPFSNWSRSVITCALLAFLVANTYLVAVIQYSFPYWVFWLPTAAAGAW